VPTSSARQQEKSQAAKNEKTDAVVIFQFAVPHSLQFRVLPQSLAVWRLAPNAELPAGLMDAAFSAVVRTSEELSLVVLEEACSARRLPSFALVERGWIGLQLRGPFPFSLTGVLASFLQPLADAKISIFAISTFDTDYVLIKRENLPQALMALKAAGHEKIGEETA
jgi:hypothetical protein